MTIAEVLKNLDNTIEGKKILLRRLEAEAGGVAEVSAQFLRINLGELDRIRADVAAIRS